MSIVENDKQTMRHGADLPGPVRMVVKVYSWERWQWMIENVDLGEKKKKKRKKKK